MNDLQVEEDYSLMLDGNAMAGLFHELFDVEMTVADLECANCGRQGELGSLWAFVETPGYVLRCPSCQGIVLRMAVTPKEVYLDARGARFLCVPKKT